MKKICFVINSFDIGGIERVIVTLCNSLVLFHKVDLIVLKNRGKLKDTLSSKVNIYDLNNLKVRKLIKPLVKYLEDNNPDYIITSIYPITILTNLAIRKSHVNTKLIVTHHALFDIENKRNPIMDKIIKILIKQNYNKAYRVFAVSVSVQRFLQEIGVKNVDVMYNPFDAAVRRNNVFKDEYSDFDLEKNYLVFIGRLAKIKNVSLILKAFSDFIKNPIYSNFNLLIIGDGPEREYLEELSIKIGISTRTHFSGSLTYPEKYIKNAKAVLLASYSEAMPVTILEAFGFNVPVVTTPARGCIDIFNLLGYKWYTESFTDEKEYSNLIQFILEHKEEIPNLAELVEKNYGVEKITSEWNGVLS